MMCKQLLLFLLSNTITAVIAGFIGGRITLWLTDRKENQKAKIRFNNRLISLAYELKINSRYLGNPKNPFLTKVLENLVYDEPLIHQHLKLFEKSQKCLYTALILSSSSRPKSPIDDEKLSAGDGHSLMKDLAQFLSDLYDIKV